MSMFKKRQSPLNVSFLYLRGENVTHSFVFGFKKVIVNEATELRSEVASAADL